MSDEIEDWVDDADDRRFREEQENARRALRKKRSNEKRSCLQERDGRPPPFVRRGKKQ